MAQLKLTKKQKKQIAAAFCYQMIKHMDGGIFVDMDGLIDVEDQDDLLNAIRANAGKFQSQAGDLTDTTSLDVMIRHFIKPESTGSLS